jgi:membrane protein required for colicin V production
MQTRIEEQIPSDAPGWIVSRYEELVNSCDPAAQ